MESKLQYYMRVLKGASFDKFKTVVNNAHERSGKNKLAIVLDMINCTLRYGAGYNDYVIFEFWDLNHKQRSTYLTRMKNKKFLNFIDSLKLQCCIGWWPCKSLTRSVIHADSLKF